VSKIFERPTLSVFKKQKNINLCSFVNSDCTEDAMILILKRIKHLCGINEKKNSLK